jgi:hypothetical protein
MRAVLPSLLCAAAATAGCAAEIGDECETSVDCSPDGDRICDRSQPGGYCTVEGCSADGCPDEALCVEFDPQEPRLARRYCMAACETGGDCRDGYRCIRPDPERAVIVDAHRSGEYCAQE